MEQMVAANMFDTDMTPALILYQFFDLVFRWVILVGIDFNDRHVFIWDCLGYLNEH